LLDMATLLEYFTNDFKDLSVDQTIPIAGTTINLDTKEEFQFALEVKLKIIQDYKGSSRLPCFYIPSSHATIEIIEQLIRNLDSYSETQLLDEQLRNLEELVDEKDLYITFRSMDYVKKIEELQKPLAFISHDSRDKDLIARPIAQSLNSKTCFVWYDEYSLKIGDHLRESIEAGIKDAKKCVLIITLNFLLNPGWTKVEFNSIFTISFADMVQCYKI
jgi:hypothetical protein